VTPPRPGVGVIVTAGLRPCGNVSHDRRTTCPFLTLFRRLGLAGGAPCLKLLAFDLGPLLGVLHLRRSWSGLDFDRAALDRFRWWTVGEDDVARLVDGTIDLSRRDA